MHVLLLYGKTNLMYWINEGGFVMWPIAALGFLGVLLIIERAWVIYRATRNPTELMQKVRSQLLEGHLKGAVETCDSSKGAIARIFKAALLRLSQRPSTEGLDKIVENAAIHEIGRLERGLWVMALITALAPILGFLGTVVGMIESFDVLAAEGMNNPAGVAHGISVALITTAGGLIVATFVLPVYNLFTTRIGTFTNEIETAVNFLFETLDEAGETKALAGAKA